MERQIVSSTDSGGEEKEETGGEAAGAAGRGTLGRAEIIAVMAQSHFPEPGVSRNNTRWLLPLCTSRGYEKTTIICKRECGYYVRMAAAAASSS